VQQWNSSLEKNSFASATFLKKIKKPDFDRQIFNDIFSLLAKLVFLCVCMRTSKLNLYMVTKYFFYSTGGCLP